ncbi:hypothetical protein WDU94_006151 [Cyamophila willieti]
MFSQSTCIPKSVLAGQGLTSTCVLLVTTQRISRQIFSDIFGVIWASSCSSAIFVTLRIRRKLDSTIICRRNMGGRWKTYAPRR